MHLNYVAVNFVVVQIKSYSDIVRLVGTSYKSHCPKLHTNNGIANFIIFHSRIFLYFEIIYLKYFS